MSAIETKKTDDSVETPTQVPQVLGARIRKELEEKILSGEWPPGHRLPYEYELMKEYECSRMTVNRVMVGLAAEGLIERRRKAGSFVKRPKGDSAVLLIPLMREEVEERGGKYRYKLLSISKPDPLPAHFSDSGIVGSALLIKALHFSDDTPFSYEERLINLDVLPEAEGVDFSKVSSGTWLMEMIPWTEAQHSIGSINADKKIAEHLNIKSGDACLHIKRWTRRIDDNISLVQQYYPGNKYRMHAQFTSQVLAGKAKPLRTPPA